MDPIGTEAFQLLQQALVQALVLAVLDFTKGVFGSAF